MIEFKKVNKAFGETQALREISFSVSENELFGLIGPDGAGKSTLFKILTTVLLPDSGEVIFNGKDAIEDYKYVRRNVGYMPGRFSLYQDLSVRENLNFFATIFNTTIDENYDLIKSVFAQLEPFQNRKAGALSGGMKQKLALSCALIHRPKVLVLDEPTFGVDAVSRSEFWENLKELQQKEVTILVSTPYMDEAELCDRVALIQTGQILKINSTHGIVKEFDKDLIKIEGVKIYPALKLLEAHPEFGRAYSFGQQIHLYSEEADISGIEDLLKANGLGSGKIEMGNPNIEDCFMDLMEENQHG